MDALQAPLEGTNDETKKTPKRRKRNPPVADVAKKKDEEDVVPGRTTAPSETIVA